MEYRYETESKMVSIRNFQKTINSIKWDRKNIALGTGTVCCGCCSVISFILAFAFYSVLGYLIYQGIVDNAVVTGPDSKGYSLWQSNINNDAPPEYECYKFFNLTNVKDIYMNDTDNKIKAVFDEIGPYCYRLYHEKYNITFSPDGTEVSYNIYTYYIFDRDQSASDAMTDEVVNMSPGYLGILAEAGNEDLLQISFTGPAFRYNINWLETVYIHHLQVQFQSQYLTSQKQLIQSTLNLSDDEFYATWANSTTAPDPIWNGTLLSYGQKTGSGLSLQQAQNLWKSNTDYSLTSTKKKSEQNWFNATLPEFTGGSEFYHQYGNYIPLNSSSPEYLDYLEILNVSQSNLINAFALNQPQATLLGSWLRNQFFELVINPQLVQKYSQYDSGIHTVSDIGWYQWATCNVTRSATRAFYFAPGGTIEYACFGSVVIDPPLFTVDDTKKLMNGTVGLWQMANVGIFFIDYLLALDPNLCPINTTTLFNKNCTSCSDCTETTPCYSTNSTITCSFNNDTNQCENQFNTTESCLSESEVQYQCDACHNCEESYGNNTSSDCTTCKTCYTTFNHTLSVGTCSECENCAFFLNCYNEEQWEKINEIWGLNYEKTLNFLIYFFYAEYTWANNYLTQILERGGGLFPKRTVNQWIYHADDPLMLIANPTDPNAGNLVQNMTSQAAADIYPASTTKTGKGNLQDIAMYVSFGNLTSMPWAEEVPVYGCTEWGQFPPFFNESTTDLYTYDSEYLRTMHIQRMGSVSYRGIELWRFMLSNATFEPNPVYYQSIRGFANLTKFKENSPIFFSNPHWAGVDEEYTSKVIGCAENQNYISDYTVCDIEPHTGLVMHVNESLQLNVYLPPDYKGFTKFNSPPIGQFYPIMYAYKQSTLSKANADQVIYGVYYTTWLQQFSFGFFFTFTFIAMVLSVYLFLVVLRRKPDAVDSPLEQRPFFDEYEDSYIN